MLRAVVADLHVGQVAGDLDRFRQAMAEVRDRGVGEVVFLGDLFRTLVGFARFWDERVRSGLAELEALRDAGARVVAVEGNRDFFLDTPDLGPFFDAAGPAHSFVAGDRRFLLEHGDLVNVRDRQYRAWRAVSKSGPARVWARLLPAPLARRIVHGTEARLARTNFTYRRALPVPELEASARRHFAAGVHVLLLGHFHRLWRFEAGSREALVAPPWAETGAIVWVEGNGAMSVGVPDGPQFIDTPLATWYQRHQREAEAR